MKKLNTILGFFKKSSKNTTEHSSRISARLEYFSQLKIAEVFKELKTTDQGLTKSAVQERLHKFGLNEIAHEKPPSWYALLLWNFANPFIALLCALCVISVLIDDYSSATIIVIMVTISVLMRFFQELRSNKAAEKLKAMVSTMATVIRQGVSPPKEEVALKFLVPGDIIQLSAGDMVPADVRLISSKELFIGQSALTGESLPVEKGESIPIPEKHERTQFELPNICFMGTNVFNGSATAVILATGNDTFFGSMATSILGYRPLTSFDIGVNRVTWLLIRIMFIMVPIVFFLNGLTKDDWFQSLLFSMAVAVGLTPEMLPMIVTANLANGAIDMSKKKVIVKRLNSIQNFGAMDILCSDKTGTLTQDRVILERHIGIDGGVNEQVLEYAYLNSFYQTGLKNLLDIAVLEHKDLEQQLHLGKNYRKIDEIPFDFMRRRMSVVVEKDNKTDLIICKGAVEEVLSICSQAQVSDAVVPLSDGISKQTRALRDSLNNDGLRVLAVAYKEVAEKNREYHAQDEYEFTLLGLIAFLDPPKSTAKQALSLLKQYNVHVKVLTGDNEIITRKICGWVGLEVKKLLSGFELEKMSDEELKKQVDQTTVFVRLAPLQKSRVIAALKSNGHTVGFLGDGINDAPALREADIGISVDTAVDIAKESADIIMLEKSLLFLGEGVIEGRKTFGNIIKYIKMAVSSNFGNVFSVLGASAIFPFLPMLPLQLLIQNLLYDLSQTTIPFDRVDKEFLVEPRQWYPKGILRFMVFIGPISSIFDYTTFALMWFVFGASSIATQSLFQTGWFVEGLLSQTLIVHMIRTQRIPFFQSMASLPLLLTTGIIMCIGIYLPYSFIAPRLGLVPLPTAYFPWLVATLLAYCVLTQLVKIWFIKRFNYWL